MEYSGAVNVSIPYGLRAADLVIDPAAQGKSFADAMDYVYDEFSTVDEERMERLFRSTVLLFNKGAGTMGECLETAIIWEVG